MFLSVWMCVVKFLQITATRTVFVRFSQNFTHMIYVPICKKTGFVILILNWFRNFDFKTFGTF